MNHYQQRKFPDKIQTTLFVGVMPPEDWENTRVILVGFNRTFHMDFLNLRTCDDMHNF